MKELPKKIMPFMWHFLKNYKAYLIFIFGVALSSIFIWNVVTPVIARDLLSKIENYTGPREMIWNSLKPIFLLFAAVTVVSESAMIIRDYVNRKVMPTIEGKINMDMLSYVHRHSYRYFSEHFSGSVANKISDISGSLGDLYQIIMWDFLPVGILIISYTILFFLIDSFFGSLLFCWIFIHMGWVVINAKKANKASKEHAESRSKIRGKIIDSITNFAAVKLFSHQKYEKEYASKYQDEQIKAHQKVWGVYQYIWFPLDFVFIGLQIAMLALIIEKFRSGAIDLADIAFIFLAQKPLFRNMWNFTWAYPRFVTQVGKVVQAIETLTESFEIVDDSDAQELTVKQGSIELKDVCFEYNEENKVFTNLNLTVKPGEKIGLVGISGSGKTTLINLLMRLFDIQSGEILIDGQNIAKSTQDSLRRNVSIVQQEASLFHRTISENIGYGRLDASQEEIEEAAKMAFAHKFILAAKDGYETLVGERGIKLSGGQRQRISIARAILDNKSILILDEATSALDSETEGCIQDSFIKLMEDKTTIAIAHRLSTLRMMDRIIVLDQGEIVEQGTHNQLVRREGGMYRKLWQMQSDGFIPENVERKDICEL